MKKIDMFKEYVGQLVFRCIVLLVVLAAYIFEPRYFDLIWTENIHVEWISQGYTMMQIQNMLDKYNVLWIYVVWAIFMFSMIVQMFPQSKRITMGSKKGFVSHYHPVQNYDELEMHRYVQKNNLAALKILLVWLSFNAIFGLLYVTDIIGRKELVLLTTFYYVCDLICVVLWCPFQTFFIKNKCCVNCRIFNWGYFMMFTPMLFIRHFFSWSLFFTSLVMMIRWELTLIKHPERFWEGSNDILKCKNCEDKICKFKGPKFVEKRENTKTLEKRQKQS
ncbi:MAG: hypothetical protein IKW01_06545 [Firmicutes bacterium]|nr:hypothetical protein [Bacillota bacterium]